VRGHGLFECGHGRNVAGAIRGDEIPDSFVTDPVAVRTRPITTGKGDATS